MVVDGSDSVGVVQESETRSSNQLKHSRELRSMTHSSGSRGSLCLFVVEHGDQIEHAV